MTGRQTLLVKSGDGPGECREAVARLMARLAAEAARAGLDIDMAERPAPHGPASAIVVLTGPGAEAMARDWEGVILWRSRSALRPRHPRKTWFVRIFRLPPAAARVEIDPETVAMQTLRAGGPGGQPQNKTSSAIRARWTDSAGRAWSVSVRDSRSSTRTGGWRWRGCPRSSRRSGRRRKPSPRARSSGARPGASSRARNSGRSGNRPVRPGGRPPDSGRHGRHIPRRSTRSWSIRATSARGMAERKTSASSRLRSMARGEKVTALSVAKSLGLGKNIGTRAA